MASWELCVKATVPWDAYHAASKSLRETGALVSEQMFTGSTEVCVRYLSSEDTLIGADELRLIPGSLRIRYALDRGGRPGAWLLSDHKTAAGESPSFDCWPRWESDE